MNKPNRPSHKKIAQPRPSTHSPSKRNKNIESKFRNATLKKGIRSSFFVRLTHEKMKPASASARKEMNTHAINKEINHKTKAESRSPPKTNKKTKKLSNKQQNKNESREIQRQKMVNQYLKSKIIINQKDKQIFNQSTQFFQNFTYTVEKQNIVNYVSQFLSSDKSCIEEDIPSQFSTPNSSQNAQESGVLKQSRIISIEQWQSYETLKLKNEQLTNYIEELQKVQKRLMEENQHHQRQLKGQALREREKIMQQYAQLNQRNMKVSNDNAVLQQMFNQGRSIIQALKHENTQLAETALTNKEHAKQLSDDNQRLQICTIQMKNQTNMLKQALQNLNCEKQQIEKKYEFVCLQKEKIKNQAQEMLKIVKNIQGKQYD